MSTAKEEVRRIPKPPRGLMEALDAASLAGIVTEVRRGLESVYGDRLAALLLFGSYARGDAEPGSDVDLLVVLRGEVEPAREISRTSDVLADVSLEHDVVVSCAYVSEERFRTERSPFLLNVRREGRGA